MVDKKIKTIIMGAAGRDFHNFNTVYRDNPKYDVVAFTATQIPDIDGRKYPAALAGSLYPNGIPIESEERLVELIKEHNVDDVVFAYSDVDHEYVMHHASTVIAEGANFKLLGAKDTMIKSTKPVISICAVRTGCGKSQTTRRVAEILQEMGKKVVAIRHPMPYGDLVKQKVQRYATYEDLVTHECTIEEREEYEPHIDKGVIVYAGVDYEAIVREAEKEADVILWDGGNNDIPFYAPDLSIVVVDPHRPGHELKFYPGESNLKMADIIVINKEDTATPENIEIVKNNVKLYNPRATIVDAFSPLTVTNPEMMKGKKVLVIEDGPTLTHGHMTFGAGTVAAKNGGAAELIDSKAYAVGTIKDTYEKYTHIKNYLPAMGYGEQQTRDLEETINNTPCDVVVSGTPIDITRVVNINKPIVRVEYYLEEKSQPDLKALITEKLN